MPAEELAALEIVQVVEGGTDCGAVRTNTAWLRRVELLSVIVQVSRRTSVQPEGVETVTAPPRRNVTVPTRTSPAMTPVGVRTAIDVDVLLVVLVPTGDGAASADDAVAASAARESANASATRRRTPRFVGAAPTVTSLNRFSGARPRPPLTAHVWIPGPGS